MEESLRHDIQIAMELDEIISKAMFKFTEQKSDAGHLGVTTEALAWILENLDKLNEMKR